MSRTCIRPAVPADAGTIVRLVRQLALFEKEPVETVRLTESDIVRDGFGDHPRFEALIAELDGEPAGFAVFFHNYSTWEGQAGLWVEDIFVEERARDRGLGRQLMVEIARVARARGCPRVELSVLAWNPAREFYARIGFDHMEEWLPYRITEPALGTLAMGLDG